MLTASDTTVVPQTVTKSIEIYFRNSPPTIQNSFSDQTLLKGQGPLSITTFSSYYDSDSDTLTVTVTSNETGVVPSGVSIYSMTLTPSSTFSGTAEITVTISDFVQNTATDTFLFVVEE